MVSTPGKRGPGVALQNLDFRPQARPRTSGIGKDRPSSTDFLFLLEESTGCRYGSPLDQFVVLYQLMDLNVAVAERTAFRRTSINGNSELVACAGIAVILHLLIAPGGGVAATSTPR